MTTPHKNTICLWYASDALEAARFYAATFPDSSVGAVHYAPGDYPNGKQGQILTVEFIVIGIPCLGLNGGRESACGWCKDKRAFDAMMTMRKIDIAAIEAARRG